MQTESTSYPTTFFEIERSIFNTNPQLEKIKELSKGRLGLILQQEHNDLLSHIEQIKVVSNDFRKNLFTRCIRGAEKIAQWAASFFQGFGIFMFTFSLLGILIDKPASVALLSVLTGMAVGCGLGLVGYALKGILLCLKSIETLWCKFYLHTYTKMEHKALLIDLAAWYKIPSVSNTLDSIENHRKGLEREIKLLTNKEDIANNAEIRELSKLKLILDRFKTIRFKAFQCNGGNEELLMYVQA
jgi:hypothetical protein